MHRGKIVVRLIGGLGNQLFTYAAARRLSIKNECDLVLDNVSGFKYDHKYRRSYQLGQFNIPCRLATPAERMEPFSRARRFIRKKINEKKAFNEKDYIVQDVFDFDRRLLFFEPKTATYIEGYWQSELYFRDIENTLRKDLNIRAPDDDINRQYQEKILNTEAVAIHYRHFSTDDATENLDQDYYHKAVTLLQHKLDSPHFFVFSDRPDLMSESLPVPESNLTIMNFNNDEQMAYADLWLMQQCRHFIIANSTFSWWGAWLSTNREKIVIAPKFTKRTGVSWWGFEGLIPENWITL